MISDDKLYNILKENQYLGEGQLLEAKDKAEASKISLYESLIEKDFISDENLRLRFSEFKNLPICLLPFGVVILITRDSNSRRYLLFKIR